MAGCRFLGARTKAGRGAGPPEVSEGRAGKTPAAPARLLLFSRLRPNRLSLSSLRPGSRGWRKGVGVPAGAATDPLWYSC